MNDTLLIATIAGLAGMLGWGFADFFAKKTIDLVGDIATLAWAHIYGMFMLAALLLARSVSDGELKGLPSSPREWGALAFFGALQAFVYFFVYRGFGKGKLALLNPVFSSYSGLVVLMSVFIFGEIIGGPQLACLAVLFFGIITISLDTESFKLKRLKFSRIPGMKDVLTASILAAFWTVLWGYFVSGKDWLVYAAIMYVFMSLTILLICLFQRVNLAVLNGYTWKFFWLIGLAEVIAYVGISGGYSLTAHTSIVAVLSAAFSVPTVILAHIFLGERISKFQYAGVFLVIAGAVLLATV